MVFTFLFFKKYNKYADNKNVKVSSKKIIEPLHPLPNSLTKLKVSISLKKPSNKEARGNVAYVPIAKSEFAFTRCSGSKISGTTASLDGCLINEKISDKKLIMKIKYKLSAKNKNKTNTILIRSQKIITNFLSNLSAIKPANDDSSAGIILAIKGTTAVSSEFPLSLPMKLAKATEAKSVAQSPKLDIEPDHHNNEN